MADQAEPVTGADVAPDPTPAAPAAPAPAPTGGASQPPAKPWADAPWAQTLETRFQDDTTRAAVHAAWQEEVQPYVTRKEQELGEWGRVRDQLQDDDASIPTFLAIAEQTYGPEVAQVFVDALRAHLQLDDGDGAAEQQGGDWQSPEAYDAWYQAQPPWVQEQEDLRRGSEEDAQYQQEVQQYAPDVVEIGADHHLARYVLAADGDVQQGKALYDQEFGPIVEQARQNPQLAASLGLQFPEHAAPAEAEGAPAVLGSSGAQGGVAPPTEPQYASLDAAMEAMWQEVSGKSPGGW
jgi:hypothetical protein